MSGLSDKDEVHQIDTLIYCMGDDAEDILQSFGLSNADKKKYATVISKFGSHFVVRTNVIYERTKFHRRVQHEGEPVDSFIMSLHVLAKDCAFKDMREEMIRDRIVAGVRDEKLSEEMQLIGLPLLNLKKATDMARESELIKRQNAELRRESENPNNLEYVKANRSFHNRDYEPRFQNKPNSKACPNCSRLHGRNYCPAQNSRCRRCNRVGHFAVVCRASQSLSELPEEREENYVRENEDETYSDDTYDNGELFIGSVGENDSEPPWYVDLEVVNAANSSIKFKIDSGADVSIISYSTFKRLNRRPLLKPCNARLQSPGGPVESIGQFIARAGIAEQQAPVRIIVVPDRYAPSNLLSRDASVRLKLIQRLDQVDDSVYGSIGKLKTKPVHITLKENAIPYAVVTPRRIPFPLVPKVEKELKKMQDMDIIEPVNEPSDWCAPIVPVLKPSGDVRICVDLTKLNRCVKRERFMIPTFDDVLPILKNARVFSHLDAASGFHMLELDESSAALTTFITPSGRFRYKRLCFGITSAPEIFQREMTRVLADIKGVVVLMDDILVFGSDNESHDEALHCVLQRIRESGIKLNKAKCKYRQSSLTYFGHSLSAEGVQPDLDHVRAIREMKTPTNVSELRRFLGMVNFLGRYVPSLSTVLYPLTQLLREDSAWIWESDQQKAYAMAISQITKAPILAFYDPNKPTIVMGDASSYGIGGALCQLHDSKLRVVAYCSRTLTASECRYAQIEKELLASVWVCERFSRFLIGLDTFELQTDHRPLIPLINTYDIDKAPIRCQRLLLRLMRFNPHAKFVPGKEMMLPDSLSRNPLKHIQVLLDEQELAADIEAHVDFVQSLADVQFPNSTSKIAQATSRDPVFTSVKKYVIQGWPKYLQDVPENLRMFYTQKDNLSVAGDLLLFRQRIFVPVNLRDEMLRLLHEGHQGISKCIQRAKFSIWWPTIDADIRKLISNCSFCAEHAPSQRREPLITRPLPALPWQEISADICHVKGKPYLVVYDQFSRWLEILQLSKMDTDTVIEKFSSLFVKFGIIETLTTDNGPCFDSYRFRLFATEQGFKHTTSSPYWPQSNGYAERAVATAKHILSQDDYFSALLAYRTTPHSATGETPAKLLMGRELRTKLPSLPSNLDPNWPDLQKIRDNDAEYKLLCKQHYDRRHGARQLPPLNTGDQVRLKLDADKTWEVRGKVVTEHQLPRSFEIQTDRGTFRRNRRHLKPDYSANEDVHADTDNTDGKTPAARDRENINSCDPENNSGQEFRRNRTTRVYRNVERYQAGFS